jgi:hypothetical protein
VSTLRGETQPTMIVRLVANMQNRLFWRVGTGRASECCVPPAGMEPGIPRWAADVPTEQRLQNFDPLRCCGQGGLDRGSFAEPGEGQMSGPDQRGLSGRFYSWAHRGWSRSREIFGACGWAAGGGYPVRGAAFGVRAGLRRGWMVAGCP